MRRHYPVPLIYPLIALLLVPNIINIGADLGAMATALRLLVDGPQLVFVTAFAVITIPRSVHALFALRVSLEMAHDLSLRLCCDGVRCWRALADRRAEPRRAHIKLSGSYLAIVVAVPVSVLLEAAEEVEDEKEDPKAKPLIKAPLQGPRQLAHTTSRLWGWEFPISSRFSS